MIAKLSPSTNQLIVSFTKIKNMFEDFDLETASHEATKEAEDAILYLRSIDAANDVVVSSGRMKGAVREINIEGFVGDGQPIH